MIIDQSYFRGDINIPGTTTTAVSERLTWFCEKLETELLQKLLGYSMWKAFDADMKKSADQQDQKWKDLRDGKEYNDLTGTVRKWKGLLANQGGLVKTSVISLYVYYWWVRDNVSNTTAIGEIQSESENGKKVTPALKLSRAWNEMSSWVEELILFMDANKATYPEWEKVNKSVIRKEFRRITSMF